MASHFSSRAGKLGPVRALAIVHQRDAGPGVFAERRRRRSGVRQVADPGEAAPTAPGGYDAVITFGGAMHADQERAASMAADREALLRECSSARTPLLGVCLGSQLLAEAAGAPARPAREPEIGWHDGRADRGGREDPLLGPLAPGFEASSGTATSSRCRPARRRSRAAPCACRRSAPATRAWGIQFHAEVTRADAVAWIDDYRCDEDAVRIGLDAD